MFSSGPQGWVHGVLRHPGSRRAALLRPTSHAIRKTVIRLVELRSQLPRGVRAAPTRCKYVPVSSSMTSMSSDGRLNPVASLRINIGVAREEDQSESGFKSLPHANAHQVRRLSGWRKCRKQGCFRQAPRDGFTASCAILAAGGLPYSGPPLTLSAKQLFVWWSYGVSFREASGPRRHAASTSL